MGLQRAGHDWATEMNWLMGPDAMILVFWMLSFKPTFSLSSFTFIKRLFSSASHFAIRVVSSACLGYWYFSQQSCAYASFSPAFHMMHSAYKLKLTPFPIWNQSIVPCLFLTVTSWPAYRFLRRQVRWPGIPISLRIFYSLLWSIVKGFSIVNKADCFSGTLLLYQWSNGYWQFDIWFLCLF